MQNLFNQFSQVLGITLLHSLWQGLIIYALLRLLFICFPSASSANKHNITLFGLSASVVWPIITLFSELTRHPVIQQLTNYNNTNLPTIPVHAATIITNPTIFNSYSFTIERYMPYLVLLWILGVIFNSAKLIIGWKKLRYIKQNLIAAPALVQLIPSLSRKLNIKKQIEVWMSEYVDVPCIIGYLKPIIILPVTVTTQFSAVQIESILLHEMAHIRRNDYFINVMQQVIAIVFFFNPFIHLINRIIYNEREHSCDDLVLKATGQPLIYAQTLLQLEETRINNWQLALAATGKKYYLLNRIKRIIETKKQANNVRHILVAVSLLIGSMATIAWLNPEIKDGKVTVTPIKNLRALLPINDSTKRRTKTKKSTLSKSKITPGNHPFNVYNSDNPIYDKLLHDLEQQSNALQKYYDGAEYQRLRKGIDASSDIIDSFYKKPEVKKLQEKIDHENADFEKMAYSPQMKELEEKINTLNKSIDSFYNTPEYKKLQKNFDEQSKWFEKVGASKSPEFKQRSAALEKAGAELRKYIANPQRKIDSDNLNAYNKQMRDVYNSPEYKKLVEQISDDNKQLRNLYQNPIIKQQQENLRLLGKQMWTFTEQPEIKNAKVLLNQARQRLIAYQESPAYKKLQEEIQKNRTAAQSIYTHQSDTTNSNSK